MSSGLNNQSKLRCFAAFSAIFGRPFCLSGPLTLISNFDDLIKLCNSCYSCYSVLNLLVFIGLTTPEFGNVLLSEYLLTIIEQDKSGTSAHV